MADAPENEVNVIHPERDLIIDGEKIIVNEFSFAQGLTAAPLARPLLDDMEACFKESDDIDLEQLGELFGLHREIMFQLMSIVTGKSRDWVAALSDGDGMNLLLTFWSVNSGFFVRRLLTRKMTAHQQSETQKPATPN